ncbi:MAG: hypothetical protein WC755_05020 [Candidatus Woesearchaeota archaeon]|jgi:Zn-dependent M32 family carboxypeptidase
MSNADWTKLVQLIKKGMDQGFHEDYVLNQLERRGYKKDELNYAVQVLHNPEILTEEEERKKQIEAEEQAKEEQIPEKKIHKFDEVVHEKRQEHKRNNPFDTFKDYHSLILIFCLCAMFFILGIVIDRLVTAI